MKSSLLYSASGAWWGVQVDDASIPVFTQKSIYHKVNDMRSEKYGSLNSKKGEEGPAGIHFRITTRGHNRDRARMTCAKWEMKELGGKT